LFAHLKALNSEKNRPRLRKIKETLTLIDWFESFDIPEDLGPGERSIRIRDRFLPEGTLFDQRSANEGFLFLLFYVTLFTSPDTPAFFSIDNIDSSLNPKLCIALLQQIVILAKEYDKQVMLTTHNPAVLDGLDLHDDEQRLLVVERSKVGHTRVRRVDPPKPSAGQVYSFGRTILAGHGSLAPGSHLSRYREKYHAWVQTAYESRSAARLVAPSALSTAVRKPDRHRVLPATRRQRRHVLLLEEACRRGSAHPHGARFYQAPIACSERFRRRSDPEFRAGVDPRSRRGRSVGDRACQYVRDTAERRD
jgi:hypothetical protein